MQKTIRFNNKVTKLCLAGALIAMGVVLSTFYIPVGSSKCFPMQHFINVVSAVLLGPWYALVNAFVISLLRNLLGIGSVLAFPGSMIGAFLAGLAFEATKKHRIAILGELLGTGVLGALLAAPMAVLILGKDAGFFFFVLPFFLSSFVGSLIALVLFEGSQLVFILKKKRILMNSVLCIAATDSSGGAGIAADIKSVVACGSHPLLAITAITAQNSMRVSCVEESDSLEEQLKVIQEDFLPQAAKIGMLCNERNVDIVLRFLEKEVELGRLYPVVLDPVMVSSTGRALLSKEGIDLLKKELAPRVNLITPNRNEMRVLLGHNAQDEEANEAHKQEKDCRLLYETLGIPVLLKGGHYKGEQAKDLYYDGKLFKKYTNKRSIRRNTHGTGCCLSATIAAYLAKDLSMDEAITRGKEDISRAIMESYAMGQGEGPVDPILWRVKESGL